MGEVTKADLDALTASLTATFTAALNTVNNSMNNQIGEIQEIVQPEQQGQADQDYKVKAEIPFFSANLGAEDYLDWQLKVNRYFEIMEVPENNQLMMERFLPDDYEQILYRLYIECEQCTRTVAEYIDKFLRYSKRNELGETEDCDKSFKPALKEELLEKPSRAFSFQRQTYQRSTELVNSSTGKGKSIQQNTESAPRVSNPPFKGTSGSSSVQNRVPSQKPNNPYARPITELCYRCNKPRHRSNVCPERRQTTLIGDYDEDEEEVERGDEYEGVEFAVEESLEKVNIVLRRILLTLKEDGQRCNIFRSLCSINNKVCNLIVENGSCENFVARKLVEYLQLPT
ncbi:uncharacterized protein LOC121051291 [Rosa chinensis]|uniref:uncharacterized protein LOC121051291 n=1 Tax=Rosa chinensis TaxID=74649 RepID=UPI001AD931E4|nr:uncharacterized protein LOC121051291 [Rosa chinensis]